MEGDYKYHRTRGNRCNVSYQYPYIDDDISRRSAEERHAFRMSKYRALSTTNSSNRISENHSAQSSSVSRQNGPVDARKAYLDKKYPRVFGSTDVVPDSSKTAGPKSKTASTGRGVKPKAQTTLSEGQREVLQWLRGRHLHIFLKKWSV